MNYENLTEKAKEEMDANCEAFRSRTCASTEGMDNFRHGYLAGLDHSLSVENRLRQLVDLFQEMHNLHALSLSSIAHILTRAGDAGQAFMNALSGFSDVCQFSSQAASTLLNQAKTNPKDVN